MKKNKNLTTYIWLYLIGFLLLIIILMWLLQVVFSDKYYEIRTKSNIDKIALKTKLYYSSDVSTDKYDYLSYENNACIEIIKNNERLYSSNNTRKGCIYSYDNTTFNKDNYIFDFINSDESSKNYKIVNPTLNNETLVKGIKLEDDTYAFINVSLEPIDSTIDIIRDELVLITIIMIVSSFIIAIFISKKISTPILNINRRAKKMAEGDLETPFVVNENIEEIKELANTLNETKQELSRVNETRKDLLANVSHDLKTPLTMISAYAEMARDLNCENKEKRTDNLNIIIEESSRLNNLVNDILELSKNESNMNELNIEEFNLKDLIKTIIHRFDYLTNEGYNITLECKEDYIVKADINKIEQVIYNLIINAVNYTGEDKSVTVKIINNKKYIRVSVIDTGKGIDKKEINKVWDKYYKNEKNHKRNKIGTGLGLSIVKSILIKHNFEYGIESKKGKGTEFYFDIKIS